MHYMRFVNILKRNLFYLFIYFIFIVIFSCSFKSSYLTGDGAFTFGLIHKSFKKIVELTSMDVHPFMYYFIAKIFIIPFKSINSQIASLRILSAFPYLILLVIGNTTIRHKFGKYTSVLFMFCIITMPLLNSYVYVLRMYSWAMLFITLTFLLFVYIYKDYIKNSFFTFSLITLFSLLASYFHYYSLIILSVMYISFFILFILNDRRIKYIICSILFDALFYIPWLTILFRQTFKVRSHFWSPSIKLRGCTSSLLDVFCPKAGENNLIFYIFPVIMLLLLFYIFIKFKGYKYVVVNIGFLIFFTTLIMGIVISIFIRHQVIQARYLVPSMGIMWFSVSLLICKCNVTRVLKRMSLIFLVVMGLTSYFYNLSNLNVRSAEFLFTNENIENVSDRIPVIYSRHSANYITAYHLHNNIFLINKNKDLHAKVFNIRYSNNVKFNKKCYFYVMPIVDKNHSDCEFLVKHKNKIVREENIHMPVGNKYTNYMLYKMKK